MSKAFLDLCIPKVKVHVVVLARRMRPKLPLFVVFAVLVLSMDTWPFLWLLTKLLALLIRLRDVVGVILEYHDWDFSFFSRLEFYFAPRPDRPFIFRHASTAVR